jgi:NADH-quinone oxidoreductase subunit A
MFFYYNQFIYKSIIENLGFFGLLSIILSIILVIVSYILIQQKVYKEKISAYECGFEPFEDARNKFDIRFYIVAILFLIFDIEVIYLFP